MGMDIGGFFSGNGADKNWRLTPTGEQCIQIQKGTGIELKILGALKQMGPSTTAEIGKAINEYDSRKVEFVLKELKGKERVF